MNKRNYIAKLEFTFYLFRLENTKPVINSSYRHLTKPTVINPPFFTPIPLY